MHKCRRAACDAALQCPANKKNWGKTKRIIIKTQGFVLTMKILLCAYKLTYVYRSQEYFVPICL